MSNIDQQATPPAQPEVTPEEANRHYKAALDSVSLIHDMIANVKKFGKEELDTVSRNVEHLKIMLVKEFWSDDHDMQPFQSAVEAGAAILTTNTTQI